MFIDYSWNIIKDYNEVINNGSANQFQINGFGDPSGGRGEAVNYIKTMVINPNIYYYIIQNLYRTVIE